MIIYIFLTKRPKTLMYFLVIKYTTDSHVILYAYTFIYKYGKTLKIIRHPSNP